MWVGPGSDLEKIRIGGEISVRIRTVAVPEMGRVDTADQPQPFAVKGLRPSAQARNVRRRASTPMDTLLKDLTYAARGLRKNLGFAAVATLTIALGVGSCTAIFSVVNAVLLRPLPYSDAQRLVLVWGELRARHVNDWPFSPPDLRDLQQQADSFEELAG